MSAGRLIHLVSSRSWDVRARYTLDLSRHFRSAGWSVTVYTPEAKAVDTYFEQAGINLRHAPLTGLSDIYTLRLLASDMRKEPPGTIVHTHHLRDAFKALVARRLARRNADIHIMITRHDSGAGRDTRLARRVYRNLDAMIFTSLYSYSLFTSTWERGQLPFNTAVVHRIHYSLNQPADAPLPAPKPGPRTALWHGTLRPGKGLETLIDAMGFLRGKRVRLIIAGTGHPDYVDTLRRRAAKLGILQLIDWKGRYGEPADLLAQAHFGVFPAEGSESFGYPNIECMAAGRAQIVAAHPIQSEYLTDGKDAVFVPADNARALADAMLALSDDEKLRERMGMSAFRRYRSDLGWDRLAAEVNGIYTSLRSRNT